MLAFVAAAMVGPGAARGQDAQDPGVHPVIGAIRGGDHVALRAAITPGLDLDRIEDLGQTALKVAIAAGDAEAAGILLKAGASPDHGGGGGGRPPLTVALMKNDPAMVRLLLDAGAEVARRDSFGYTMFGVAFSPRHGRGPAKDPEVQEEAIRLLYDAMIARDLRFERVDSDETVRCIDQALCDAARAGSLSWCRTLLDAGASPDAIELRMYTPLMCAAMSGNEAVVRLLLDRGADPHIALTPQRRTALWHAVRGGKGAAVVRAILERYGPGTPELRAPSSDPESVAAAAARAGDAAVIELLRRAAEGLPLDGGEGDGGAGR